MVDCNVGEVFDLLCEFEFEENMIVFFMGDNGG